MALPEISRRLAITCSTTVKPVFSGHPGGMAYLINLHMYLVRVIQQNENGERVNLSHNKVTSKCFYLFLCQEKGSKRAQTAMHSRLSAALVWFMLSKWQFNGGTN